MSNISPQIHREKRSNNLSREDNSEELFKGKNTLDKANNIQK